MLGDLWLGQVIYQDILVILYPGTKSSYHGNLNARMIPRRASGSVDGWMDGWMDLELQF